MKNKIFILVLLASVSALMLASGPVASKRVALGTNPATQAAMLDWTTPVNISNTSNESRMPVVSGDVDGNAYITWTDWTGAGMSRNMMFNTNRTGYWPDAFVVSPLMYSAIDDVGFPTVVVTPSGSEAMVAYHDGDLSIGKMVIVYRELLNGIWGRAFENFDGAPGATSYITLAVSPIDATIFGVFMHDTEGSFELAVRYKDGVTGQWSAPALIQSIIGPSKYTFQINQFSIDAKGTAHLVYTTHYNEGVVYYTKNATPKNINTWTPAFQVSGGTGISDTYPKIDSDAAGEAYVVWPEISSGSIEVMFRRTINGQWQDKVNLSQTSGASEFPAIAVSPTTKEIYVAWQEQAGSSWDVYRRTYEAPAGSTTMRWGDAVNVTNGAGASGEPNLRVDPKGNVHFVYVQGGEIMYSVKKVVLVPPKPKVPLNPAIDTRLDGTGVKKINKITWQANPDNANLTLKNYRIYRKLSTQSDSSFALLASVGPTILLYEDLNLDVKLNYSYYVTALAQTDDESDPSATVTSSKKFEFAPLNPAVQAVIKTSRVLFYRYQEKRVSLSFEANPLNVSGEVSGYEIFRKNAGDGDDQFASFAVVDASTFTYQYTIKAPDSLTQKYAYAVKTLFTDGRKSPYSAVVTEQ